MWRPCLDDHSGGPCCTGEISLFPSLGLHACDSKGRTRRRFLLFLSISSKFDATPVERFASH